MKKVLIAAVAVLSIVGTAAIAQNERNPWLGWVARHGDKTSNSWERVEVVVDRNGCQYLVATGGSTYSSASYGISITPRINSTTKMPHCT